MEKVRDFSGSHPKWTEMRRKNTSERIPQKKRTDTLTICKLPKKSWELNCLEKPTKWPSFHSTFFKFEFHTSDYFLECINIKKLIKNISCERKKRWFPIAGLLDHTFPISGQTASKKKFIRVCLFFPLRFSHLFFSFTREFLFVVSGVYESFSHRYFASVLKSNVYFSTPQSLCLLSIWAKGYANYFVFISYCSRF